MPFKRKYEFFASFNFRKVVETNGSTIESEAYFVSGSSKCKKYNYANHSFCDTTEENANYKRKKIVSDFHGKVFLQFWTKENVQR